MIKKIKTIGRGAAILALACVCAMKFGNDVEAAQVVDTVNGVSYNDEMIINIGYAYDSLYGATSSSYIDIDFEGDRIGNVKSSSSNLLVKKTKESFYNSVTTDVDYDYDTEQYVTTVKKVDEYSYAYIGYYAKKKGKYTVSFDVIKPDGSVRCTKTITVNAQGSNISYVYPFKKITYAGKELGYHYPYAKKNSGKLKVSMKKGYKLVSIEIGKYNKKNELVYKKVKNNKKITLAKSHVYKYSYSYSSGGYSYDYDDLFPFTYIKITYKNKKTGDVDTYTTGLYTLNKKQMW